jgi:5-methyltetrahydrofolate--homocysteine methyltransferase
MKQNGQEHLQAIIESFSGFKYFEAVEATKQALKAGVPAAEIRKTLMGLFLQAVAFYDENRFSLAHLTAASTILEAGFDLAKAEVPPKGKVVIGTLGSSHYLGKDIIKILLRADGFEVVDIGEIVFPNDVTAAVEKEKPDIVALACMIVACLPLQSMTIEALQAKGLRDGLQIMVGGAVTSEWWANAIKADGWAPNAPRALEEANRLLRQLKEGV